MKPSIIPKNQTLNCLFLLSLIIVLVITFFSTKIPLFVSFGQEIETLLFRLSISFISSYIFYILVVHYKSYKDKKNIYPYIYHYTESILKQYKNLFTAMKGEAYGDYEDITYESLEEISFESIENTLLLIDVRKNAPLYSLKLERKQNWIEFLVYISNEIELSIDKLLLASAHLDSDLLKILFHIKSSSLLVLTRKLSEHPYELVDNNFCLYIKEFYDFHTYCKSLHDYTN